MITTSLRVLTSYIVWTPSTYYDLHYKAKILIGCAYYYAFLASLILTYEIDYMYKFDDYPEIENYELENISDLENNDETTQEIVVSTNNQITYPKQKPIILAHFLSGTTILITTSWLSITKSYANITILVLIAFFPIIANILISLQKPFNQYLVSLNKK